MCVKVESGVNIVLKLRWIYHGGLAVLDCVLGEVAAALSQQELEPLKTGINEVSVS